MALDHAVQVLWVCQTKGDILKGLVTDPNRQWTVRVVPTAMRRVLKKPSRAKPSSR